MSDKNEYNKDLMDKGWTEMSTILDREMPVKEKKRRYPLFWILGVLCLGSIGVIWFSINNEAHLTKKVGTQNLVEAKAGTNNNVESQINDTQKKDVANVDVSKEIEEKDIIDNKKTIQSSLVNEENNNSLSKYNFNVNLNKEQLPKELISNPKYDQIIIQKIEGKILSKEIIENNKNLIPSDKTKPELLKNEIKKEFKILEPIALLGRTYLDINEEEIKLDINKVLLGKWKYGIEAGFVFQDTNDKGINLAFIATREINNKWNFHTGIELNNQIINYSKKNVNNIIVDSNLGNDLTIGVVGANENINLTAIKINSYYLKLPLTVGYKVNPSFEIRGGAIASYQFYSNSRINTNLTDSFALADGSEFSYNKINPNFEIQGSLGLMYYPRSKWGIGLRYDHGFVDRKITVKGNTGNIRELELKGYQSKTRLISLSTRFYF